MMRFRRGLRLVHLVFGLGAGVLVATTGLTGSILAFRGEIDRGLNPSLWRVEPATGSASLERVRSAVESSGGPPLRMLLMPDRPDRALMALRVGRGPRDRWEVFVDPHYARILGRRRFGSAWVERVRELHVELFSGKIGRFVVGVGGLAPLLLGATGMALWWRSRPSSWRPRSGLDWHRAVGIVGLVPSTVLALTGALLIFRPYLLPVLNRATGPMPLEAVVKSHGDRSAIAPTLDQIRDRALLAYPDAIVTRVYLPEGPDGTFAVRLRMPEDQNPHGNTALKFDRFSGEILRRHSSRGTTPTQKLLWYSAYPWHTGDALGIIGKPLVAASGLVPTVLLTTGISLWWRRLKGARGRSTSRPTR